jgi:hypothetical protein
MAQNYNIPQQLLVESNNHVVFPALLKTGRELTSPVKDRRTNPYTNVPQGSPKDDYLNGKISELGTPVLVNVVFPGGSFIDENGATQSWKELEINNIICTVKIQKRIIKTEIQGRNGDVKEYIGLGDYMVEFDGAFNGKNGVYPIDDAKALKTMLIAPQPLAVGCWWLQNLGVDTIVVEDWFMPQVRGEYATQYFNFSASSDKPVEARINA